MITRKRCYWICTIALLGFSPIAQTLNDVSNKAEVNRTTKVKIGPADFESTIPPSETEKIAHVAQFELDITPVSNADFLKFVLRNPEWQRDQISRLFADEGYLSHWASATSLSKAEQAQQAVVRVSWFAATAYCEAHQARLPRWYEWELAAAADSDNADARKDAQWRQQILNWYSENSSSKKISNIGMGKANYYGVKDLHGLIWEWVEDYNSMLVGADNREQGGADKLKFCGAGALSMEQKENYALLMRVAFLSSLEARYTTRNLGFRCAHDIIEAKK